MISIDHLLIPIERFERLIIKINNKLVIILANLFDKSLINVELEKNSENIEELKKGFYLKKLLSDKLIYEQIHNEEIRIVIKQGFSKDQYIHSKKKYQSIE